MCVVRIGIRVCTGSNGAAFLLPSPIPSVGMRVRCVREDMINPLQFIFRQLKLILFILWNLFSSSLASVLFLFACADAASVHYNHSFDSRNRGVSILSSFFLLRRRLCVEQMQSTDTHSTKVRNKANRRGNKSHRGENSCKQFFCSFCVTFSLSLSRSVISQVVLFERLWTFVHIFFFLSNILNSWWIADVWLLEVEMAVAACREVNRKRTQSNWSRQ